MPAIPMTAAQRKDKRADAHHLDPVVSIGTEGLSEGVIKEIDAALNAHGLIKVRVFSDDRSQRETMFASLSDQLGAAAIQHIGKLLVLWRPRPEKERSEAVEGRMPGPKVVKILKFSKSGNHRPQVKKIRVLGNERLAAGGEIKRARKRASSIKKTAAE